MPAYVFANVISVSDPARFTQYQGEAGATVAKYGGKVLGGGSKIEIADQFKDFWPRIKELVVALRGEFEAEGNGFICDSLEREADDEYLPAIRANAIRRYLYHVRLW